MIVFVVVGAVGLVILLASIFLGDILDAVAGGDGLVSGVALGAALAIYGVGGVLADQAGIGSGGAIVIAVALAIVALVVVQLAVHVVAKQESGGSYSPVGMVGEVTSPTSPTGGEVRLEHVRELERRLAVSDAPLSIGTRIRVVSEDGYRVRVEPRPDEPSDHGPNERILPWT